MAKLLCISTVIQHSQAHENHFINLGTNLGAYPEPPPLSSSHIPIQYFPCLKSPKARYQTPYSSEPIDIIQTSQPIIQTSFLCPALPFPWKTHEDFRPCFLYSIQWRQITKSSISSRRGVNVHLLVGEISKNLWTYVKNAPQLLINTLG